MTVLDFWNPDANDVIGFQHIPKSTHVFKNGFGSRRYLAWRMVSSFSSPPAVHTIAVYVHAIREDPDGLNDGSMRAIICADDGGSGGVILPDAGGGQAGESGPGNIQEEGTTGQLTDVEGWVGIELDSPFQMASDTTYWILVGANLGGGVDIPYVKLREGSDWPSDGGQLKEAITDSYLSPSSISSHSLIADQGIAPILLQEEPLTSVSATNSGTTATFTKSGHTLVEGQIIEADDYASESNYEGPHRVISVDGDDFDVELTSAPSGNDTGTIRPFAEQSCALAEVNTIPIYKDVPYEVTLTTPASVVLAGIKVPVIEQNPPASHALKVVVSTSTGGGGTERATGRLVPSRQVLPDAAILPYDQLIVFDEPYTSSAEEVFIQFSTQASAGKAWKMMYFDNHATFNVGGDTNWSLDYAGDLPTKLVWTGDRDDAGNDKGSISGQGSLGTRIDTPVRLVKAPDAPLTPIAGFLKDMTDTAGLWLLNEPPGTSGSGSVKDYSGNNNDGTPTDVTFGVDGLAGRAARFNDTDPSFLTIDNDATLLPGTDDFAMSVVVRFTPGGQLSTQATQYFLRDTAAGGAADSFAFGTVDDFFIRHDATVYDGGNTSIINEGEWVLIAFNVDRDDVMTVYVNGVSVATVNVSSWSAANINTSNNFTFSVDGTPALAGDAQFLHYRVGSLYSDAEIAQMWQLIQQSFVEPHAGESAQRPE